MPTVTIANKLFSFVSETRSVVIPGCEIHSVSIESVNSTPPAYAPGEQLRGGQTPVLYTYFKLTVKTNFYNGSEAFSFDLRTPIDNQPSWANTLVGARFASDAIMSIAGEDACCDGGGSGGDCVDGIITNSDSSFNDVVTSGATLVLPDVTHTDSDGSPVALPGMVAFVATPCGIPVDSTVQLKDSASVNIGSPVSVPYGSTNFPVTAPDGTVKTTDGVDTIGVVKSAGALNITTSVIRYTTALATTAQSSPSNTEKVSTDISPAQIIPFRDLKYLSGAVISPVTMIDLVNDTLPVVPDPITPVDSTIQRKDSVGTNIGAAITVPYSSTNFPVTSPDASVLLNSIVIGPAKSNGSLNTQVLQGGVPVGSKVGSDWVIPTCPVVPTPSGIAYQFGYSLWSGQVTSYGTNDEGALKAAGWFDYIPPVYPLNFAELATRTTLINVNIHGNTNRFTARNGTGTYTIPIIQDHLTGLEWYRSLLGGDTWQNAIDACVALTIDSSTGWYLPPIKVLQTIMDYASTGSGTYFPSPFLNGVNIYSSSVMGQTTSQAWTASSGQIANVTRASVSRNYYAVRRFI